MEQRIVAFFVAVAAALWLLCLFPRSMISQIAFTWIGPTPQEGETWGHYQLRWAFYALDWFGQIAILFLLLYVAAHFYPSVGEHQVFLVLAAFALPIGAGIALVATATYLSKAAKARYIGPNPILHSDQ